MLRINCFFQAEKGKYEAALEAAVALTNASQKDKGCISYDVFESATRSNIFMICETWTDEASLKAHMAAPHFAKYVSEIEACGTLKLEQFDFPAK